MRYSIACIVASTLACLLMILSARGEVVPPSITIQPQSQTVVQGGATTFSVTAAGDSLAYQWWLNGATIPDGTNPSCTITNVQPINAGDYHVVVSNEAGSTNSATVTPPAGTTDPRRRWGRPMGR